MYQLTIEETQPLTDEEKEAARRERYGFPENSVKTVRVLSIKVTDLEFQSIKKAVLEVM